ncbi:MAG: tetratricopeptide repeat protein [Chlamydiales bacterium]|nr:tetratricopeptide repeat protein [Chlamydiales bacterium]
MSEDTPIAKTLKEILHTQSYDKLDSFTDQQSWGPLTHDERLLLARLFVIAAESDLKRASDAEAIQSAKKLFHLASSLAPDDGTIWYRRGLAFGVQESLILLEESSVCLEKALSFDNKLFEAWYAWGNVLVRRGIAQKDPSFFTQAEEKFAKAEPLLSDPNAHLDFYWHYGLAFFMMGRHSGEAGDTHKAIGCYRKAKDLGLTKDHFYNDFANALVELSLLINNHDLMFEAIELYLYSLDSDIPISSLPDATHDRAVRYCNLGACYQYLFEMHHEETYFKQAQECFAESTTLKPDFGNAWAFWGYMLLYAAKLWQDISYLESCLEKLGRLDNFADDKPLLLSRMSEAFSLYGGNEEDLKFLTDAQEIAETATIEGPDLPYTWASLAVANLELGRYFSEETYFQIAIENAERAIALNDRVGISWHVLAVAKYSLGEFENDLQLIQEACAAFSVAAKTDIGRFGYMWNDWGIALLNLADLTHEKTHVQEAVEKFERAILLHEQVNPVWLINYGSALDFWGDISDDEGYYEKAIEVLQHALTIDPTNTQARYHLGLALCHEGELSNDISFLEKGIEELQTVLREDSEDETAWADVAMAYMNIAELTQDPADIAVRRSLYELAEQQFLQAIALGSQSIYYSMACLYSLQENGPEAYHFLLKAFETDTMPPISDVLEDRWLEYLRSTPNFQQFLKRVQETDA